MIPDTPFIKAVMFMIRYDHINDYDFFILWIHADQTDINSWVDNGLVESFIPYSDGYNFTLTEKGKELMAFAKL